jgi:hypothetical protein
MTRGWLQMRFRSGARTLDWRAEEFHRCEEVVSPQCQRPPECFSPTNCLESQTGEGQETTKTSFGAVPKPLLLRAEALIATLIQLLLHRSYGKP